MGNKGGEYEREISKQLSLWVSKGKRDDLIWRTSASGGRATTRSKKKLETAYAYGDLTFTDPKAKPLFDLAVIEAKRGYTSTSRQIKKTDIQDIVTKVKHDLPINKACSLISRGFSKSKKGGGIDILDVIDNDKKEELPIIKFLEKARKDALEANVPYFWLLLRRDGRKSTVTLPLVMVKKLEDIKKTKYTPKHLVINLGPLNLNYLVTSLDDWLKWARYHDIRALYEQHLNKTPVERVRVRV
jgi:hypothetical protein